MLDPRRVAQSVERQDLRVHDGTRVLLVTEREPDAEGLGGVEIHVADLAENLPPDVEPFGAHLRAGRLVVEAFRPERRELCALPHGESLETWVTALLALRIDVLHVHSPQIGPDVLSSAASAASAPIVLTLHDTTLERIDGASLVDAARAVIAPSRFIRDLVVGGYPELGGRTRLIGWGVPPQQRCRPRRGERLRVAVLGVLAPDKGAELLPHLMRLTRALDIEWHLFGATEGRSLRAIRKAAPDVVAHGAYRRSELGRLLDEAGIDLALLPSIVPESFSMTLSECASAAVPVVASNVGALRERVMEEEYGWLFDPREPESLVSVLGALVDGVELDRVRRKLESRPTRTPRDMASDHAAVYRELALPAPNAISEERSAEARRRFEDAAPGGAARLRQVWRRVRRSKLYRELPLRRLLPEPLRARIERGASAILDRFQ